MKPALESLRRWLKPRGPLSHKGDYGHVLLIAGSRGMSGAAVLAARAALRAGCGLVTAAVPQCVQGAIAQVPEALTLPLPETASGSLRAEAVAALKAAHEKRRFSALAVGPGLGTEPETAKALIGILGLPIPAVVDADALNLMALMAPSEVGALFKRRPASVLTPHPGEMARLLRLSTSEVAAGRESAAKRLCAELGGVCLLKGKPTVVTDGGRLWLNPTGNPGLAKGGSGDVLTGLIAGLWSQHLASADTRAGDGAFEAAALGAYLHGSAADLAAAEKTQRALLASDVIEALPRAFRRFGWR